MCKLTDTVYKNGSKEMDQKEIFFYKYSEKVESEKVGLKLNIQ